MKKALIPALAALAIVVLILNKYSLIPSGIGEAAKPAATAEAALPEFSTIIEPVRQGEALSDVFERHGLDSGDLHAIVSASRGAYNMGMLSPGNELTFEVDRKNRVRSMSYEIDDNHTLNVARTEKGFRAEKTEIPYETSLVHISGTVKDNLVSSIDDLVLALSFSDIFEYDIDFNTDIREGDAFKIVAEEHRLNGEFKKYGHILAAEFTNGGKTHHAYRFEQNGKADYFDRAGKSLRKSFLKAPLSYRRISSGFTKSRLHPVLKTYRPHLGVDYSAPTGTPVSSVGDGTVVSSGYKGANGNQVVIKHTNGYTTYYGHLSKIAKGVRAGSRVRMSQVIGYVGSTGLSTGPHLDYRIKKDGKFVNPLTLKLPSGEPVGKALVGQFGSFKDGMDSRLSSIEMPATASAGRPGKRG